MKVFSSIISTILSFFIIFAISLLICLNVLDNKLMDKEYVLSKMYELKIYDQISSEVESGFEKYIYQSGLPEEIIKGLFTEEMIKNDVNSLINCLYDGTEITLSDEILRNTLDARIQEYLASQNKTSDKELQNNIKKFEDLIVEEYKKNVNVSTTLYTKGFGILEKIREVRNGLGNWPIIILLVLIVVLVLLNIKDLLVALNFLAISSLSLGVVLKLGVSLIFKNIDFDNLLIFAKSLSNLISGIAKENLYLLSDNGNLFIFCGIVGIVVSAILRSSNNQKPKRRFANSKKEEKNNLLFYLQKNENKIKYLY